jgi:non-specific serine/threonine protein kinase/serine/threonine-protein kinase
LPIEDPTGSASTSPFGASAWPPDPVSSDVSHAKRIGPYILLERVGEGGMAVVYKARQTEPVDRIVALKLLKLGEESDVVARFRSERQALAILDHPNIARIFDAGSSPTGRPYFAMEYVAGEPITAFCDRHRLSVVQRLELFTAVCDAVQHAHFKGILHRDLKPSNVLVAAAPDTPTVKVIDFGIAKAIGAGLRLSDQTMHTQQGLLIGTPEYMSPEQASGDGDVDTRADVYSLGVLLYELLGGSLPLDETTLRARPIDEVLRTIRESPTPAPSARFTRLAESARKNIAIHRSTDGPSLVRSLKGDLDWIVLKAVEKDRSRRYATPSDLAADIERHLNHQPVLARPPSRAYVMARFVRRHRVLVSAAAAVFLALVLGIIGTGWGLHRAQLARRSEEDQRRRAQTAADISNRVNTILTNLLAAPDPERARGKPVLVRDVMDVAVKELDKLHDQPLVEAALRYTIGNTYLGLGEREPAYHQLLRAYEIRRSMLGEDAVETGEALVLLVDSLNGLGRAREAEPLARAAVESTRRAHGQDTPTTVKASYQLAMVLRSLGKFDEAIENLQSARPRVLQVFGPESNEAIDVTEALASTLSAKAKVAEAEPLLRAALESSRKTRGADSPRTLETQQHLAQAIASLGRNDEADALLRDVLERCTRVQGPEHPDTLAALNNFQMLMHQRGDLAGAEKLCRQVLEVRRRTLGDDHPDTLVTLNNLVNLLREAGRAADAEQPARDLAARRRKLLGDTNPGTLVSEYNLGLILVELHKAAEAESLLRDVLNRARGSLAPEHPGTYLIQLALADLMFAQSRFAEAEGLYGELIHKSRSHLTDRMLVHALAQDGASLVKLRQYEAAEPLLLEAQTLLSNRKPDVPVEPRRMQTVTDSLIALYDATGRADRAEQLRRIARGGCRDCAGERSIAMTTASLYTGRSCRPTCPVTSSSRRRAGPSSAAPAPVPAPKPAVRWSSCCARICPPFAPT